MGVTVDPTVFIIDWLNENWNAGGVGFTPTFSSTPRDNDTVLPAICIKSFPADVDHLNLGSTYHYYYDLYGIDIWDTNKGNLWKMIQEVRRIVFKYQSRPTTTTYTSPGIESILISEEIPNYNFAVHPPLLQHSIRVFVEFLEINT